MQSVTIPAHFDGEHILLDEPYTLMPNTKLLITVFQDEDLEREDWLQISAGRIAGAFGEDEPEYPLSAIIEVNPRYEGR